MSRDDEILQLRSAPVELQQPAHLMVISHLLRELAGELPDRITDIYPIAGADVSLLTNPVGFDIGRLDGSRR